MVVIAVDRVGDGLVDHLPDELAQVAAVEHALAHLVKVAPLLIGDLVVFEQVLADAEVAFLDLFLGALDTLGELLVLDGHALFERKSGEHFQHPLAHEQAQQVVVEGEEEA